MSPCKVQVYAGPPPAQVHTAKFFSMAEKKKSQKRHTIANASFGCRLSTLLRPTTNAMPGRQAHGRSLVSQPKAKKDNYKKSKARSQKNALNAFGIAQESFPTREKRTPRARLLEPEVDRRKHARQDDDDEDEGDEEDEEMPERKRMKRPNRRAAADGDAEFGSDSEGNEWQLGGMAEDDEDSEIESDEAFGESDEEKFAGYNFGGGKSTKAKVRDHWERARQAKILTHLLQHSRDDDDSEDDSNDDEGETLGEDAIDLATALDQWEEESEEEQSKHSKSRPDDDDSSGSGESGSESDDESNEDSDDSADEDDEEADPEQLQALHGLVSGFGGDDEDDKSKDKSSSKQKISIADLGLGNLQDPHMKSSLKLMNKEQKEKRPGAAKKLDVPLARRQQDRLDRSAAYAKTNETLDRWTETVKHNRRAEHLIFPLPETTGNAGLNDTEMQPLTASQAHNELETAVLSIMDQSGLSLEKPKKEREKVYDDDGNELTRKEIQNKKRLERELQSREAKRAARIKKIKSKAYHRVHRKQKERDEMAAKEAMEEAGEIDSEEEREAHDRRRALERMGLRHKDSKWAKMGSKVKRAVWDEDFRSGLTEMARQNEELRRRKEGKSAADDSDTSSSGSDSEDGDATLRRQLAALEGDEDDEPRSGLMSMKFMQKAEAARKKENDDLIRQIRRELDGEDGEDDDAEPEEIGRRQYGAGGDIRKVSAALDTSKRRAKNHRDEEDDDVKITLNGSAPRISAAAGPGAKGDVRPSESTAKSTEGAWSRGEARRSKKGTKGARVDDLDLTANIAVASRPSKKSTKATKDTPSMQERDEGSDSDDEHLPLAIRDQALVARAFAGEDVVGEFEREKEEMAEADDDKVIDNTLPGWGSWVGEGVSAKEKKRHQGRFLTKVEGIKKKDRKDAKLDKVIINEKRIKKVCQTPPLPFSLYLHAPSM